MIRHALSLLTIAIVGVIFMTAIVFGVLIGVSVFWEGIV